MREVKFTELGKERIECNKEINKFRQKIDSSQRINDEMVKEIEKLKNENEDVKRAQRCTQQ